MSDCLSNCLVKMSLYFSVSPSVTLCLIVCLNVSLTVCLTNCLAVCISVCLNVCPACLTACLPVCLHLSVGLSFLWSLLCILFIFCTDEGWQASSSCLSWIPELVFSSPLLSSPRFPPFSHLKLLRNVTTLHILKEFPFWMWRSFLLKYVKGTVYRHGSGWK